MSLVFVDTHILAYARDRRAPCKQRISMDWLAALRARCSILLSEDLQHEQFIDGTLRLINPFADSAPQPPVAQ